MSVPLRLLIIEDSENDALLLVRELRRAGYDPAYERVDTTDAVEAALGRQSWDLIIGDYNLPRFRGTDALALVRGRGLDTPFIFVSGTIGEDLAVAAMKAGASDYVMKGNLKRLAPAIERELREAGGRRERQRLEEELRQAHKMEAVGQLAGGIAHDFNNLLTVIISGCDLLSEDLAADHPSQGEVTVIRAAAERAAALTGQLLAFSRRQLLQLRNLDANAVIAGVEGMLRRLIGENVALVTALAPGAGVVRADRGQLEQVIINLVVNARDAMPHGGTVAIETAAVEVDEAQARVAQVPQPGRYVRVAVRDAGVGMDAATKAKAFEPFFTTKGLGKGTGLGLATVYGIVKQSGGGIVVESEPDRGTTVTIHLPRIDETADAPGPSICC